MDEKILIVEDEKDIARLLDYNLKKEGYRTVLAHEGSAAPLLAAKERPRLVILDLMLPGLDGLEVCRRLKADAKTASIPIIMLTAKGEEADKVLGLGLGADDYVTKPFSVKELLARVKAVLRRSTAAAETLEIYRAGDLELDCSRVLALVKGKPLEITARGTVGNINAVIGSSPSILPLTPAHFWIFRVNAAGFVYNIKNRAVFRAARQVFSPAW